MIGYIVRLLGWSALIVFMLHVAIVVAPQSPDDFAEPVAPSNEAVLDLVERHDCWTGQAPAQHADDLPGGVIVTSDRGPSYHSDQATISRAMGQILAGEDHGLTVHAFCPPLSERNN